MSAIGSEKEDDSWVVGVEFFRGGGGVSKKVNNGFLLGRLNLELSKYFWETYSLNVVW